MRDILKWTNHVDNNAKKKIFNYMCVKCSTVIKKNRKNTIEIKQQFLINKILPILKFLSYTISYMYILLC